MHISKSDKHIQHTLAAPVRACHVHSMHSTLSEFFCRKDIRQRGSKKHDIHTTWDAEWHIRRATGIEKKSSRVHRIKYQKLFPAGERKWTIPCEFRHEICMCFGKRTCAHDSIHVNRRTRENAAQNSSLHRKSGISRSWNECSKDQPVNSCCS